MRESRLSRIIRVGPTHRRVFGIPIEPAISNTQQWSILGSMPPRQRVAFVDLVLTPEILSLIRRLLARGHTIVGYFDHHRRDWDEALCRRQQELATTWVPDTRIVYRSIAPSLCRLVPQQYWLDKSVDVVFHHFDFDGFLALLWGAGVTYDAMADDADYLDGTQTAILSTTGEVIRRAMFVVGTQHAEARIPTSRLTVFRQLSRWLHAECDSDRFQLFLHTVDTASQHAARNAEWLVKNATHSGGVAFADGRRFGQQIDFDVVHDGVRNLFPDAGVLAVRTRGNRYGDTVVAVTLRRDSNGGPKLRTLLPPGVHGYSNYRVLLPFTRYEEFEHNATQALCVS